MANLKSWHGDWHQRILDGLEQHGVSSVLEFASRHPTWTYRQLAEALGADIAPIHVQWVERDEAIKSDRFADFARSCLARTLLKIMPPGWGRGDNAEFRLSHSMGAWSASLGEGYTNFMQQVLKALKTLPVPTGWLPSGPDDPLLAAALDGIELRKPDQNA